MPKRRPNKLTLGISEGNLLPLLTELFGALDIGLAWHLKRRVSRALECRANKT